MSHLQKNIATSETVLAGITNGGVFFEHLWAKRIGGAGYGKELPMYKFEKIRQAKEKAKIQNPEMLLLDFGIGEPDTMADKRIIDRLYQEALKPENRVYADNGCLEFCEGVAQYMLENFGVVLDPKREVLHSMGIKAALSLLPACFINPGDVALVTTPGYPVGAIHTRYYGGGVYELPLMAQKDYLPDLKSVPSSVLHKTKLLILNYPNNPTGALATFSFYEEAVFLAKKYNFVIIQDAAYASLVFDKESQLSILNIPGAKKVAIELYSFSKSFSMTGWRIGWVCGSEKIVGAYGYVKGNTDSGQFLAIQKGAKMALEHPGITEKLILRYKRRSSLIIEVLSQLGFRICQPKGTFFIYVPVPKGATDNQEYCKWENAEAFSQWLITRHLICTVPWDEVGSFIRFSMTFEAENELAEQNIAQELYQRLSSYVFEF